MKKKLRNKLTHNLALKIISVIIAILIWYVVIEISDPVTTKGFDVPVNIINANYIETGKKTYVVDDRYKTIKVTIRDNRSKLADIDDEDIKLEADLTQIVNENTDPVYVPLRASCPNVKDENISLSQLTIPVTIEDIEQAPFTLDVDFDNTVPNESYEVGKVTLNPATITISGPKSMISIIDGVKARINVDGMTEDGVVPAELKVYDKNGVEFTPESMGYLRYDIGQNAQVQATVDLWKKLRGVKVKVDVTGEPAWGYQIGEITTSPSEITMVGTDEALAELVQNDKTITIPIPDNIMSVENKKQDVEGTLDLKSIFGSESPIRPSASTSSIVVNVTILPNGSKEFELDVEQIKRLGMSENLTYSYDQSTIPFRVKAPDDKLESFDVSKVEASIDLSGKGEGDYPLTVNITVPEGYELVDTVTTTVHLKQRAESALKEP